MVFNKSILVYSLLLFSSCAFNQVSELSKDFANPPSVATETTIGQILKSIPRAGQPITVSVYEFADQTGQNKSAEIPQYSRAVTQGGLAILKKALLDAGNNHWFRVLERGGLNNLLQERKIIRSMRNNYLSSSGKKLPALNPLLYSGLLLEGGIISYESNVITGGAGAKYLGIGGSTEYRRDIVTVYLSAVSVSTGEVVLSTNSSKTIYSASISGGAFKFVSFDRLLEVESGITVNEPPQLAVRQAIEMSVYSLIMEGWKKGLWSFKNKAQGNAAYQQYLHYTNQKKSAIKTALEPKVGAQPTLNRKHASVQTSRGRSKLKSPENGALNTSPQITTAIGDRRMSSKIHRQSVESLTSGWYVQLVSVKEPDEGIGIVNELKSYGMPIMVQRARVNYQIYYRILLGPYRNQSSAARARGRIKNISSTDAREAFLRFVD